MPGPPPATSDPPGTASDPDATGVAATLNTILAQLMTINSSLETQSETINHHAKLLGAKDSSSNAGGGGSSGGGGGGSGGDGHCSGGGFGHQRDNRDLHNAVHRPKLTFPHFDGLSDPLTWLNKCESFFRGTRTVSAEQVWMASLHLDGVAADWYYALDKEYGLLPWARFVEFINLRFGPPIRSNTLGELKEPRRTGTVEEYQR